MSPEGDTSVPLPKYPCTSTEEKYVKICRGRAGEEERRGEGGEGKGEGEIRSYFGSSGRQPLFLQHWYRSSRYSMCTKHISNQQGLQLYVLKV